MGGFIFQEALLILYTAATYCTKMADMKKNMKMFSVNLQTLLLYYAPLPYFDIQDVI